MRIFISGLILILNFTTVFAQRGIPEVREDVPP